MNGHVELWLWDYKNEVWVKQPAAVKTIRKIAVGEVVAGAARLYWISMNPSAANSVLEITDAVAIGGDIVFDMYHATRDHMHMLLNPPMPFVTGIWIETLTSFTSVMFGYV